MRALVQRVSEGWVKIESESYFREIGKGIVILLGIHNSDTEKEVDFVADKCSNLRIFEDNQNKMNLSVKDIDGEVLVISQFTLYGDARKGNRPSFTEAALPEYANKLYELFLSKMKNNLSDNKVQSGLFGEMMQVKIMNEGPVTILIESK
ncbi:MAG: D-tyrosyl-tRNA(Tyr) deacylase [Ignavibacteria bacterium]|nr:D-tyrosyl-tRNA(Tyr) deacylase [Ignavibacteria bacterium]